MKSKRRFVKVYTSDDCSEHQWVQYTDAKRNVDFILPYDDLLLQRSRRGVPWKCVLAYGTRQVALHHPELFNHPVLQAYVIGSAIYIFTLTSPNHPRAYPQAIRYRHNFTKTLRSFDKLSKSQFVEMFGDKGCEIRLKPPVRYAKNGGAAKSVPQPFRQHEKEQLALPLKRFVGARLRAAQAHLLSSRTMGGPRPTV